MSRGNLIWLLTVPTLVVVGLVVTFAAPDPDKDYQLVRTIADVLATVEKNYVRKLNDDEKRKLVEDMIQGGLSRLDPHSQYLNEQDLALFETASDGEYGGVGITMDGDAKPDFLVVQTPIPKSPAYDAGFQPGDHILAVDGRSTNGMTIPQARKVITGKVGTPVKLTVRRGAGTREPEEVTLKRATIELFAVTGYTRTPTDPQTWEYRPEPASPVAYVRISTFNQKTGKELREALETATAGGAKALILDLRDNPGGLLTEAREMADLFLAAGTIVSTRTQEETTRKWTANDDGSPWEKPSERPMVVLVNHDSASASEIVAAALQDNKRAVLIGERTYGKGSVQKVFDLTDKKTALKLTFEEWLTPNGKHIHRTPLAKPTDDWGVQPDAGFEVKVDDAEWRKYVTFRRAVDIVPGKPGVAPEPTTGAKPLPVPKYDDPVVRRALEHLKKQLGGVGARRLPADGRM